MISGVDLVDTCTAELTLFTITITVLYTHGRCVRGYTYLRHSIRERRAVGQREERFITLQSEELLSVANKRHRVTI